MFYVTAHIKFMKGNFAISRRKQCLVQLDDGHPCVESARWVLFSAANSEIAFHKFKKTLFSMTFNRHNFHFLLFDMILCNLYFLQLFFIFKQIIFFL